MPKQRKYELKQKLVTGTVGERIAGLRKTKGLTQEKLGEKIGISQKLVAAYEKGYARIYDEMLVNFSVALNVSTDIILGIKNLEMKDFPTSIKVSRRIKKIESLDYPRQKKILSTLDDLIAAAESKRK